MKYWLAFFTGIFVGFITLFGAYYYFTHSLPEPESVVPSSLVIQYSDGTPFYLPRALWYDLSKYPQELINTLILSEDEDFYNHMGIDTLGFLRAIYVTLFRKTLQGGSTITQQLARSLYLTQHRTIERKVREFFVAFYLEKIRTKDEILELYLNTAYMGNGIYGFGTAAKYYFGKEPGELTLPEIAILVNTVKSPENFNPKALRGNYNRAKIVLKRLLNEGVISDKKFDDYVNELGSVNVKKVTDFSYNEQVFWRCIEELKNIGFSLDYLRKGFVVKTTLNKKYTSYVEKFSEENNGVLVVNYLTGEILAYFGEGINKGRRQTGSLIKPLYYYKALLDGYNLDTKLFDMPIKIGDWTPQNFEKNFTGQVTLEDALVHSKNVPSVNLYLMMGDNNIRNFLINELKISGYYPPDLTLALGTLETSHEELFKGFSAILNGGIVISPRMIDEIIGNDGMVYYRASPKIINVITPEKRSAYEASSMMIKLLREVVVKGTGIRANIPGKYIVGKTGTAAQFAWFMGADGATLMIVSKDGRDLLGGRDVAPLWKKIAREISIGSTPFFVSKDYTKVEVLKNNPLKYIDYNYLVEKIKKGEISLNEMVSLLKTFDQQSMIEFLSYVNQVSQEITLQLWERLRGD
ncbi:penicillin-binding protein [Thermosipho ferrireducens]|uniref:peptidoglycan glycosyltransferase n=1 Tax=Thermosipho ferrireducens TaxID=2571116 RepID=A0ABX7S888_9BACT|nr:transglycosylase domain-containing protein [Thermosipho ferrireducens]QTA38814.1 penicillin-binding protein [Thermosipho ferrireducens]